MTLRTLLAAALAAGALVSPPAHAADSTYTGGCGFDSVSTLPARVNGPSSYQGVVFFAVALLSDPPGAVVEAEVSCEVWAEGVLQDRLGPVHVTGAGVAAGELTFRLSDEWSSVSVCDVLTFPDGSPPVRNCPGTTTVCDFFCQLNWELEPYEQQVEGDACHRLGAQAPGVAGVVDVLPEGDVYVAGEWAFDCPPYGPDDTPAPDSKAEYDCWGHAEARRPPLSLSHDSGYYLGEMVLTAAVTSESRGVSEALVRCEIRVNGVTEATIGPVHVLGAGGTVGVVEYAAGPTDDVDVCVEVEFLDGTPPDGMCFQSTSICDTRCVVEYTSEPYVRALEADTCAALAEQAPGVPGVTDVTPEGDVYVGGTWAFDCPPYGSS